MLTVDVLNDMINRARFLQLPLATIQPLENIIFYMRDEQSQGEVFYRRVKNIIRFYLKNWPFIFVHRHPLVMMRAIRTYILTVTDFFDQYMLMDFETFMNNIERPI